MKPVRAVKVSYRDEDGVMRAIPNVKLIIVDGSPEKVYTLYPRKEKEMIL